MVRLLLLFAAHRGRGRMALSIVGIALGVALGYGVHLVNRAAVSDVAAAVRSLAGEADLEVRGGRTGFAEALYPKIAQLPGVAVASPALELDVGVAGTERTLRISGIDILRAALLQPSLILEDRYELLAPDRVFLSTAASEALGLGKGDAASPGGRPIHGEAQGRRHTLVAPRRNRSHRHRHRAVALRAPGRAEPHRCAPFAGSRKAQGRRSDSGAPAARQPRRGARRPGRGERLSLALVPGEPERACDGGALHRRIPGVLRAGARGRAPPRRACAVTGSWASTRKASRAWFWQKRRCSVRSVPRSGSCLAMRSRWRRCAGPARTSAPGCSADSLLISKSISPARWSISWPEFSSPCSARSSRRSTPRAPHRRARSRPETSRRSSSASRRSGPGSSCSASALCWRSSDR